MAWLPRIRAAGWLVTGRDGPEGSYRYLTRHLFVRLEQHMDGSGRWSLEVADCARGADGRVIRVYDGEQDARQALASVQALSLLLTLVDHYDGTPQTGRWQISQYELGPADEQQLGRRDGVPVA
jgi:hypothetical protein